MAVMKASPTVARNVVMLAIRHAIEDAAGGNTQAEKNANAEKVSYRQTFYQLALDDFKEGGCPGNEVFKRKLSELLPNWNFEYRATEAERQNPKWKDCPAEVLDDLAGGSTVASGHGVSVKVGDFYVVLPSAIVLTKGLFEQGDGLRLALNYRDRISQAIIDRNIGEILQSLSEPTGKKLDQTTVKRLAFGLLNEAWQWSGTAK